MAPSYHARRVKRSSEIMASHNYRLRNLFGLLPAPPYKKATDIAVASWTVRARACLLACMCTALLVLMYLTYSFTLHTSPDIGECHTQFRQVAAYLKILYELEAFGENKGLSCGTLPAYSSS